MTKGIFLVCHRGGLFSGTFISGHGFNIRSLWYLLTLKPEDITQPSMEGLRNLKVRVKESITEKAMSDEDNIYIFEIH